MINPVFTGKIINNKLILDNKKRFQDHVNSLNLEGKEREVVLTLKKKTKPRSNNQNAYYWSVILQLLSEETGYTIEEMHEAMKFQLLLDRSGILPLVRSTTDLSTVEMEEYLKNCREWASKVLGIYIPLPNEGEYNYSL